ncbi:YghX family hydrolase [Stappia sp.]|uniref:YghX family hydrolase n=1 Tax=Stappia sp. TaxID=1870903 RepID=UPI003A9A0B72
MDDVGTTAGSADVTRPARKTAKDFPQELLELYDFYAHGRIDRREFLDRAAKYTVGGVTALALLQQLSPNYALAQQVAPDDPAIETSRITYPSPNGHGEVNAYLVRPAGVSEKLPAVLVIHENRGLNPYIEDVARRMAKAGFMAMAPDGLSSVGGYPGNDDQGRELQRSVDATKLLNDFFAGFEHLAARDDATGKVGAVGFCYGGGVVNAIAVAYPELAAGAPFYGRQASADDVPAIEAPLQLHYAALDDRINAGWPAYEAALKAHGKSYEAHIYPGVNHGFHNDTTPRYDETAAKLAEERVLAFFGEHLS